MAKATFSSFSRHKPLSPPSLSPEPVSDPSIQILSQVLANGSCTITLNCTAARGDSISYSWGSQNSSISQLCSRNGSLLHLSYPLQNTSIPCTCTASNPISTRVIVFNSSKCSYDQGGKSPVADLAPSSLPVLLLLGRGNFMLLLAAPKEPFGKKSGHCVTCPALSVNAGCLPASTDGWVIPLAAHRCSGLVLNA